MATMLLVEGKTPSLEHSLSELTECLWHELSFEHQNDINDTTRLHSSPYAYEVWCGQSEDYNTHSSVVVSSNAHPMIDLYEDRSWMRYEVILVNNEWPRLLWPNRLFIIDLTQRITCGALIGLNISPINDFTNDIREAIPQLIDREFNKYYGKGWDKTALLTKKRDRDCGRNMTHRMQPNRISHTKKEKKKKENRMTKYIGKNTSSGRWT